MNQSRPRSSISDLVDSSLIGKSLTQPETEDQQGEPVIPGIQTIDEVPVQPKTPVAQSERTGDHTNIQKMFRLTPSAYRTLKELAAIFSEVHGFDDSISAMIRAFLRFVGSVILEIQGYA
ncbi:MAG: hypothetical protein RLN60_03405 [Phycisphaerales bacterium]